MSWSFEAIEDAIIHLMVRDREFGVFVMEELKSDYFVDDTCGKMLESSLFCGV